MRCGSAIVDFYIDFINGFGIAPAEDGVSIVVNAKAPAAPKVAQMLKAWSEKRAELAAGEISEEEYREWKSRF